MFGGYHDPRQVGATFYEGWLRSGDLGHIGEDGEVYVTGRAKDIIIRGGHNIDPAAIEDVALRFPGVGLAAAVGRPGFLRRRNAGPVRLALAWRIDRSRRACATLSQPASPSRRLGRARSSSIDEMPMTLVGKIYKPRCASSPPRRPRANC